MVKYIDKNEVLKKDQDQPKKVEVVDLPIDGKEFAEQVEALEIPLPSEVKEKGKDKKGDNVATASKVKKAPKTKAQLLKELPPEPKMRKEVKFALKNEISNLEKQKNRMISNPLNNNFNQLNIIVQKLRELKHIFATLAQATYEMLKNLWLKYVHGIY